MGNAKTKVLQRILFMTSILLICTLAQANVQDQEEIQSKGNIAGLLSASAAGDIDTVRTIIASGIDLNRALQYATLRADTALVKELLAAGANPNIRITSNDSEPIIVSTVINSASVEIVKALIAGGADVNAQVENYGFTALLLSASHKSNTQLEIMKALIESKAEVNSKDYKGYTALIRAVLSGALPENESAQRVKFLLSAKADINAADNEGKTALIHAVLTNRIEVVRILLQSGAKVNIKNKDGWTPLMYALEKGNETIVKLIKAAGAEE